MSEFSSYYLYQRYEKRGSQDLIPCTPTIYSISGDSANPMPLSIKNECDYQCGCNTKFRATYLGGATYELECDGNPTLSSGETYLNGYTHTAMTDAVIGDCVTTIGTEAFLNCTGLTSVTIPSSVITIGKRSFQQCYSLTSITIPNSVTSIGGGAFQYCSGFTSINIPNGVTSISDSVFLRCINLTSINIPSGVTSIGDGSFYYCPSLTSITIPNAVTSISKRAFQWCSGLTSVTIGSSVTTIGEYAFYDCTSLTSITVNATTPPTLGGSVFYGTSNCPIYVPAASVQAYKSATGWSNYSSRIQAIS